MNKFIITRDFKTYVKRFHLIGRKIEFKIKKPDDNNVDPSLWFKSAVDDIVQQVFMELQPEDFVGFTFCGDGFKERGPGWINYRLASKITPLDIWEMISKIFQSNSEGTNTDSFCLEMTAVRLPRSNQSSD